MEFWIFINVYLIFFDKNVLIHTTLLTHNDTGSSPIAVQNFTCKEETRGTGPIFYQTTVVVETVQYIFIFVCKVMEFLRNCHGKSWKSDGISFADIHGNPLQGYAGLANKPAIYNTVDLVILTRF